MSHALVTTMWHSAAPLFVKRGVLGALCAWANDDGTFPFPPTVTRLFKHDRYPDGRRLCERTVQYQLRLLEKLNVLSAPPQVWGRGRVRRYRIDPAAIAAVTPAAVLAAAYAKGANRHHDAKGAINPANKLQKRRNLGLYIDKKKKRKDKRPRNGPAAPSGDVWAELLEQTNVPRWDRLKWLAPLTATPRGAVIEITADPAIAGYVQRNFAVQLHEAAEAVGVHIAFVS